MRSASIASVLSLLTSGASGAPRVSADVERRLARSGSIAGTVEAEALDQVGRRLRQRLQEVDDGAEGARAVLGRATCLEPGGRRHDLSHLAQEPRLSDSRLADEQDDSRMAALGPLPRRHQLRDLVGTLDEPRLVAGAAAEALLCGRRVRAVERRHPARLEMLRDAGLVTLDRAAE
jgi:hypothetical protein